MEITVRFNLLISKTPSTYKKPSGAAPSQQSDREKERKKASWPAPLP